MLHFEKSSLINAPVETVFSFHERPDVFQLLTPPWQKVKVVAREGGLKKGARVEFLLPLGPFKIRWVAWHTGYRRNAFFVDEQIRGPFRKWTHRHGFVEEEDETTRLTDSIDFSLPFGKVTDPLFGWLARMQLRKMFDHRHQVTARECVG